MVIKQRTKFDCVICTIAMALGKSYADVLTTAVRINDKFDPDVGGLRRDYEIIEAFGLKQMVDFRVMHRGGDPHAILSAGFFRQFAWGRRSIMAVPSLNFSDSFHSIYWNGSEVLDPSNGIAYSKWDELLPIELILFAERPC